MLSIIIVPVCLNVLVAILLLHCERRCRMVVVADGHAQEGMMDILMSKNSRLLRSVLTALGCWYVVGLALNKTQPPCNAYQVTFGFIKDDAIPCQVLKLLLATFAMISFCVVVTMHLAPFAVTRFGYNIPGGNPLPVRATTLGTPGQGLSQDLLRWLPSQKFGDCVCRVQSPQRLEANSTGEGNCSVCLEEFTGGDLVRQLPCRHVFHQGCIDAWLSREPHCPLRCPHDVRCVAVAAMQAAALERLRGQVQLEPQQVPPGATVCVPAAC